ncbi:ABC transporter substrate-binding protein [Microvirga rosea]|uniref:ABC transporter substrate-binding protein n=1 Tax=Microvirga rosea TaxID=2715425 RepID=UPI001D0A237F|nr:ABC transporter substrate-binding protein [Microvirga rosea]MCB8821244.1 ABC transporter substrate-binding protein [Microvirga rosea]
MRKFSAFIMTAALAVLGQAASSAQVEAGTLDEILKRGELRVAVQTQGPPFSFMDKNGARSGSAVELAKLMADKMGVKIVYLDFDWDGLLPALMSGKADILAADMTPTLTRATKVAFTKPFMYVSAVAFAKGGGAIKSIEDCKKPGATIAVLLGSSGEKLAPTVFPQGKVKSFKGGGTLLLDAVATGQADCGLNDNSAVAAQAAAYDPGTITIFPELLTKEPLAYAVRYDSMDLLTWANLFIDTATLDGSLQANIDYWVTSAKWKADH